MTLKEYLNQTNPEKQINVVLTSKEYTVAGTYKSKNGEVRKRVYIKTENSLLAGIEYCLVGKRFYTTDNDGNPKYSSCFRIE